MTALPPARILDVEPDAYHDLPGFSASLAKVLIRQSPLHAKDVHDRHLERLAEEADGDDGDEVGEEKQKQLDRGSVYHALILGVGKRIEVIPSSALAKNGSYGTAESKALRDAARAAGRVPVKEPEMERYQQTANAMKARIAAAGHVLDGHSEFAIGWWEPTPHGPVECRCMLDHVVMWGAHKLPESLATTEAPGAIIYELKPVGDASPDRCQRTAESLGYGIAAAAYQRALTALYPRLGGRIEFRFLWPETRRPYALWDPVRSGMFRELGEQRWLRAVRAWGEGLATGRWPGYRCEGYNEIDAPQWALRSEGFTSVE